MGNLGDGSRLAAAELARRNAAFLAIRNRVRDSKRLSLPDLPHTAPLAPLETGKAKEDPSTRKPEEREVTDELDSETGIQHSEERNRAEGMQVDLEEEDEEEEALEVEEMDEIDIVRSEHSKVIVFFFRSSSRTLRLFHSSELMNEIFTVL